MLFFENHRSIETDHAQLKSHHKLSSFGIYQQTDQLKSNRNWFKSLHEIKSQCGVCDEQSNNQNLDYINRDNKLSCPNFRAVRSHNSERAYIKNTERLNKLRKQPKSQFISKHSFL